MVIIKMRKYNYRVIVLLLLVIYLQSVKHHPSNDTNFPSAVRIGANCQIIFEDNDNNNNNNQKLSRQDNKQAIVSTTNLTSSSPSSSSTLEVALAVKNSKATSKQNNNSSNSASNDSATKQQQQQQQKVDTIPKCTTYDNKLGNCISIEECDSLKNEGADILRKSTCGFQDDGLPQVCCAITIATTTTAIIEEPATTNDEITNNLTSIANTNNAVNKSVLVVTPPLARATKLATRVKASSGDRKFLKECGTNFSTTLRIVGGTAAAENAWPWFALLMIERRGNRNPECGAALIDDRHILTAAHCVVEQPGNRALANTRIIVRLGEKDLKVDNDHVDMEVEEIMAHPLYQSSTFKNDIALLRLTNKVNFTDAISPVCLPHDHERLRSASMENQTAWVIGFGRLNYNGRSSAVLRQADLKIVSQSSCATAFSNVMKLTKEYVCAAATGDTRKDSCQGDSGGPLLMLHPDAECCRWYIYGIVSFGYRCATPGYPGIYTRVNKYLDWIESKM